ncbi:MAG TPA: hypothetical protein VLD38_05705 [Nitrosopumilaceae archaeon]|nr:hypothetical protein [Nitrosopumilaceae archaeon]
MMLYDVANEITIEQIANVLLDVKLNFFVKTEKIRPNIKARNGSSKKLIELSLQ